MVEKTPCTPHMQLDISHGKMIGPPPPAISVMFSDVSSAVSARSVNEVQGADRLSVRKAISSSD